MHRHESNCKYDITIFFYTVLLFGCWWYAGIRDDCQSNKTKPKPNIKKLNEGDFNIILKNNSSLSALEFSLAFVFATASVILF